MADSYLLDLANERDTEALAAALARHVPAGIVIGLDGPLGAGKTRLTKAIVNALGGDVAAVHSPTFTLIHEYDTDPPVIHVDAYRLESAEEFIDLGGDELLASGAVAIVEWASRLEPVLPRNRLNISIEPTGETSRRIRLQPVGEKATRLAAAMLADRHQQLPD